MSNIYGPSKENDENHTLLFKKRNLEQLSGKCTVLCWNVWPILNENKLENLLQILEDNDISVACITESWFDAEKGPFSQRIKSRGYELHHAYREGKRGGGSAIMFKKQFMIKKGSASSSEYSSHEYSFIVMTLQSKRRLVIVCVYRKQEVSFNSFYEEFSLFMEKISSKGEIFLVVGDFNVWVEVEDNQDAKKLTTLMNAFGLVQKINDPTHREGHTLDHVYINEYQLELDCQVLSGTLGLTTDHFPILMRIPSPKSQNKTQSITFRKLKDVNMERFREDLQAAFNSMQLPDSNFKEMYLKYHDASQSVVDQHSPVETRRKRSEEAPWMDKEYRQNRTIHRQLERKWKKNRSDENRSNYVSQKKVCTELALSKQTHHYSKLIEDSSHSQRSLFKVANELLDKNSEKVLPTHDDPKQLADEFNNFFVDKVKKIRNSIPPVNEEITYYTRPFNGEMLMEFEPTNIDELRKIVSRNGVKTCMEDPIPSKLFVQVMDITLPVITKLVNQSLAEGSMEGVNWSVLDPLLKKAGLDFEAWKNYRPVNNLLYFSKLTERVVATRLDDHMDENSLHESSQFAYKAEHNTETMMLSLTDEAFRGFDNNMATVVIFLDLSAAFDTIDISKILQILNTEIGIGGTALQWFKSFLTGRTQRVKINGQYSESLEVPFGAPQGSVLGPKIFNINVRSQPLVFKHCKFSSSSFADDSNGRRSFSLSFQYNVLTTEVQKCMDEIILWSNDLFMKINPDKTEIALLRPSSLNNEVIINGILFHGQCIRFSEYVKNVGVVVDQNLSMDKHVSSVVSHSYKILKDIGRVKKYMTRKRLEELVHAVIANRLDYCNSLFVNISRENIFKLQKVQNTAARLILGRRRRDSAKECLRELHWLNIDTRITFKILLLVFKVLRGKCNMSLTYKGFNGRPEDFLLLKTPTFKTKYGQRTFEYNGSRLWNALPLHIRTEENIEVYKSRIKTLLFEGDEQLKQVAFKYKT